MQNKNFKRKLASKPQLDELIKGILEGNFMDLSRGITICESKKPSDRERASQIVKECLPHSGNSIRVGITGVPGVGKSTFIEAFGLYLVDVEKKKVAVLAVDPTSSKSKGSILGDKTRMEKLSSHPSAYIRPSPASGALGGVSHHSRESIILCEAAGFDTILVETVGVGQSETDVKEMTDFFLLLMLAGAGDELQGIKRGIIEMADAMLINKADGENIQAAKRAKREYQNALHLFPQTESGWIPKVEICSALEQTNMNETWELISKYSKHTKKNGYFKKQRNQQLNSWFNKSIEELLHISLFENEVLKKMLNALREDVLSREIAPVEAAKKIFDDFIKMYKSFLILILTSLL